MLIKFKWRVIQKLMDTYRSQTTRLLSNLKEEIADVKAESAMIAEFGDPRKARKCDACVKHPTPTKKMKDSLSSESDQGDDGEDDDDQGLCLEEFIRLLRRVGIDDPELARKLFWIFDEDGSGDVDHKELAVGLEMINNTTYIEKISKFFDLCDDDQSGSIDRREFYQLLKLNLNDYEDKKRLKTYVKEIFRDFDYDGDGTLDKREMMEACLVNWNIKNLIEKNLKSLKNLER